MKFSILLGSLLLLSGPQFASAGFFSKSKTAIKGTCESADKKFKAKIKLRSIQGRQEWLGDVLNVRVVNRTNGDKFDLLYDNGFERGLYTIEIDQTGQRFIYYGLTTHDREGIPGEIRKVEFNCDNYVDEKVLNFVGYNFGTSQKSFIVENCLNCTSEDAP